MKHFFLEHVWHNFVTDILKDFFIFSNLMVNFEYVLHNLVTEILEDFFFFELSGKLGICFA